jgi:hypothetical protein
MRPFRRSLTFVAKSGDLIVMGGRCQKDWVHCLPKELVRAAARISMRARPKRSPTLLRRLVDEGLQQRCQRTIPGELARDSGEGEVPPTGIR